MPEAVVDVAEVKAFQTKLRQRALRAARRRRQRVHHLREAIARDAVAAEGKRAHIEFHEQQRGEFTNVYLDKVEPLPTDDEATTADEVGWRSAIEAAPYLVTGRRRGARDSGGRAVRKLQPFKELVAEDIRESPKTRFRRSASAA